MRSNTSDSNRHSDQEPARGVNRLTPLDRALDGLSGDEFLGLAQVFQELQESACDAGLEASERVLKEVGLVVAHAVGRRVRRDFTDDDRTFLRSIDDFYDGKPPSQWRDEFDWEVS